MTTAAIRICVPVTVERLSELPSAVNQAAGLADIVELRLDYLKIDELENLIDSLPSLISEALHPLILTLRPADQGGRSHLDLSHRLEFWFQILKTGDCYFDLELDVVEQLVGRQATVDWGRIICSHHDFSGGPANLEGIYQQLSATPAGLVKIAVAAKDAVDCVAVFHLLDRGRNERRRTIAIAMGEAGQMTRILGPARGSFLTYASTGNERATAPGQTTAREIRELYRIHSVNPKTAITGLIGNPVSHSISPDIHNPAFAQREINAVYIPFEVHDADAFLRRMIHPRSREIDWNLRGLSVTAPHKLAVLKHLDRIDPAAREIGAVNTIVVQGRELHGYNTDAEAFIEPLRRTLGSLKGLRCAIIGAGGAARAALWALRKERAKLALFVRNQEGSQQLAKEFDATCKPICEADFNGFDVIVNATPLGTRGRLEDETPATAAQMGNVRLVYDLVYNPLETRFLSEARAAGCKRLAGLEMLVTQAAAQFKLWTDKTPDVEVMRSAAINALSRESKH